MITIPFSYNWNRKLDCKAFTTIRLYNPGKHVPGTKIQIWMRGGSMGTGTIMDVKPFLLEKLNPFMSYLDMGYSVEEGRNVILKMYPTVDFKIKKLAFILILKD